MTASNGESERVLYAVSIEPESGYEERFNRWYNEEHAPELLACPGFLSVRRFEAIEGSPRFLTLYDLESIEAMSSEEYQALRRRGPDDYSALAREVRENWHPQFSAKYREVFSRTR